jgi:hypothetical protein
MKYSGTTTPDLPAFGDVFSLGKALGDVIASHFCHPAKYPPWLKHYYAAV